jgi:thioesterase domain-containing protein
MLDTLQAIIDNEIQPAKAMQFRISDYDGNTLSVSAPKAANTNHHGTVFGGSQYALAAVAGWALLRCKLHEHDLHGTIVVKSASMDYLRPVTSDVTITVELTEPEQLSQAMQAYADSGSANFTLRGLISQNGKDAARYTGTYSIKDLS